MSNLNDDNTRAIARQATDSVSSMLAHFHKTDATWGSFGKSDYYLEYLRLHLLEMLRSVETELQERSAVEPIEFGT